MRCLIFGASGQVGGQLADRCRAEKLPWIGTAFRHPRFGLHWLDLRDRTAVTDVITRFRPDAVFLPAAMTHVDRAEKYPSECYEINIEGTEIVARAVRDVGGALVFFSTEHVFPETPQPAREDDPVLPVSEYARSKAEGECRIREILPDRHLILRTSWVYGPEEQGKNFVYRAVRTLRAGQTLVVPNDQFGQPTYGPDLARTAIELCRMGHRGTFHVVGPLHVSRLEFAHLVATIFELDADRIVGRPTADLGQAAPRPLRVCLADDKVRTTLERSPIRHPADALRKMRELLPPESKDLPFVA
jgi:dTDP-4-dehydrorhamnose reductase